MTGDCRSPRTAVPMTPRVDPHTIAHIAITPAAQRPGPPGTRFLVAHYVTRDGRIVQREIPEGLADGWLDWLLSGGFGSGSAPIDGDR